jgi:sulfite reductase (NADPH) flavoprotein alpha-component
MTNIVRTVCPYCGVGCGMLLHVAEGRVVKVQGDPDHPANFGKLCAKGITCGQTLESDDRLRRAHLRTSRAAVPQPVTMDDAITFAARRLCEIIDRHGPDAVAFYVSGQLSMECQYIVNKLCKGHLRTNNIDSNSRLCMSSAASGYKLSLGADGPPGSYQDFELANCFLVMGANMADCHPILFLRMLAARKRTGAKLIVVDPRRTATAEKADLHLAIAPGTDLALLNGLLHLLLEAGHVDPEFIAANTDSWEEMPAFLADYTPTRVAEWTGLDEADIRTAARWIGESAEVMSLWTMGLNQSTHGTWQTNAICNLHLATGKICRPGSGPFSLTGQPNAMGGREMGYLSHGLPGQRAVTNAADRAFTESTWGLQPGAIRPEPGLDAVSMFKKIESGEVKAIWIIGTNPVATMPRRAGVTAALERAELVIVQDAYHPTETGRHADVLLPGAVWAEAEGVMVNSERAVTLMQKAVEPPGDVLPDWKIIARVARAMGFHEGFSHRSAGEIFDEAKMFANPRTGYDLRGMTYAQLRDTAMQWPCGPEESEGRAIRYRDGEGALHFPTETGRAQFFARPCLPPGEMPDAEFPIILTTGRVANQWHTRTKTGKVEQLNKLNPGPFVEIHPEDAALFGLVEGQHVEVQSRRGAGIYPAFITDRIRPGVCFVPFHWNDLFGENLAINAATSDAVDAISLQPELKFCAARLVPVPIATPPDSEGDSSLALEQFEYLDGLAAGQTALAISAGNALPIRASALQSIP